ncbi:AGAP000477-PA-like protein [Anopheles sinensis]|uniref:AGAP000477-PA-like protein n=1 Tax=Anopheles sinensis TaxID=74873 RepID=A0A084WF40_ANOSI|nr:AGAP000477-PA-like protein [Anopheles sinensis]
MGVNSSSRQDASLLSDEDEFVARGPISGILENLEEPICSGLGAYHNSDNDFSEEDADFVMAIARN